MTRTPRIYLAALLLPAALAGCGGSSYGGGGSATASNATSMITSAKAPALALRNTSLGKVLVDARGRTLYMFGHDTTNKSRCAGACATNWPPAAAPATLKVGAGVAKAKLKAISRAGGSRQLSYAGHPLYRFAGDAKPGDVKGQGINAFGGIWDVVSAAGAPITGTPRSGSTTTPGTSTGSGGGYPRYGGGY
jgi:predicted lipoprotein with Yx(FWY)xxD motif